MKETHPDQRYLELAEKWLNGTITPEEAQEYADWYNNLSPLEVPAHIASDKELHRRRILHKINKARSRKPVTMLRVMAAAAVIVAIAFTTYYYLQPAAPKTTVIAGMINDIQPGHDGAILRLANGRTIVLDTASNGQLTSCISKSSGGVAVTAVPGETQYNTLITPRARQQQLTLSDGTKVWLNAESSITFPTSFANHQRTVQITGEAYFEVAKQAIPFIVQVTPSNTKVQVLGTHFNINAYQNEAAVTTTLVEGSVRVGTAILKPGEEARGNNVQPADVELAIAWKNGMQSFASADLKTVMRQIERWYDVDVEYKGNIPMRTFTGDIPRNAHLSEVLKLFEVAKINFTIDAENKKLTVMP